FPDSLVQRLEDSSDPKQEGRRICIELIERIQKIDGIAGVHLMAPGQSARSIAELLSELGK
ncbi:MAG: methylenetetrahydrofolate reductase, partial [Gammaproteobacteria bacterium]|nr:methylenetetrahydrofolate reductase [Gammaproteobacteria bacterium]